MANFNGFTTTSHTDVFYNRIWLLPQSINFTGLPVGSTINFNIWNSYNTTKNLNTIFPTASLVNIGFSPASGFVFDRFEKLSYTATSTASSPNYYSGTCLFDFTDAEDVTLAIQGQDFESFIYPANWISDIQEYYSYLTDVRTFNDGSEQRSRRRKTPRRGFSFNINPTNSFDEKAAANTLRKIQNHISYIYGKTTLVPEWHDQVRLASNLPVNSSSIALNIGGRDFQSSKYCMLYNSLDSFEILKINTASTNSITFTTNTVRAWNSGTRLIPIRTCIFSEDSIENTLEAAFLGNISARFSILAEDLDQGLRNVTYTPDSSYLGKDVVILEHNFTDSQSIQFKQDQRILDFEHTVFAPDRAWFKDKKSFNFSILLKDRNDFTKILGLFNRMCGSWKSFWLINKNCELEITNDAAATTKFIYIKDINLTKFMSPKIYDLHVYGIDMTNNIYIRKITNSAVDTDGRELLTLNEPFGINVTSKTFKAFGFLTLVRFAQDDLEITWNTDSIGFTSLSCIEVFNEL